MPGPWGKEAAAFGYQGQRPRGEMEQCTGTKSLEPARTWRLTAACGVWRPAGAGVRLFGPMTAQPPKNLGAGLSHSFCHLEPLLMLFIPCRIPLQTLVVPSSTTSKNLSPPSSWGDLAPFLCILVELNSVLELFYAPTWETPLARVSDCSYPL